VLHDEALRRLQQKYALERTPDKKRKILEQMLDSILPGWEQLFLSLSKDENPHRVLRLLAELSRVADAGRGENLTSSHTMGTGSVSEDCF
jgi:hypothetical protein